MRSTIIAESLCVSMLGLGTCFAQSSTAATTRIETRILPQRLGPALQQFEKLHHMQVLYLTAQVKDLRTNGASGKLTVDETLSRLLSETGLKYRYVDVNAVSIIPISSSNGASPNTSAAANPPPQTTTSSNIRATPKQKDSDPATMPDPRESKPPAKTDASALREVIVTGTHIAGVAPASPTVEIGATDIHNSGLPDIGSVIRALPQVYGGGENPDANVSGGLNGGSSVFTNSTANLRGIGGGATLTLLDGHRIASSASDYVDMSSIPTMAVERIDIETGGASAVYGADAVAGVINIALKNSYNGAHTDAYVGGTAEGGLVQRYSQLVGRTSGDGASAAMLGYQFQSQDEILTDQRAVSQAAQAENAKSSIQPQQKSNSAFLSAHQELANQVTGYVEGVYNHRTNLILIDQIDHQGLEDQFASNAGLRWNGDPDHTFDLNVTWSGDSATSLEYSPATPASGRQSFENRFLEFSATGQGELVSLPGDRIIRAAAGVGIGRQSYDAQFAQGLASAVASGRKQEHAYIEVNVPVFPDSARRIAMDELTFNAAGRTEHYSDFGTVTEPKLGLIYLPVRQITISGTWGKSFQAPTLQELYSGRTLYRYPGHFFVDVMPGGEVLLVNGGNPKLEPETATTSTATVQWRPPYRPLHGLNAAVSYYDIDFRGVIHVPISSVVTAVSNPVYAPFVVLNPSVELQSQVASSASEIVNLAPVNPAAVQALIFNSYANLSRQVIHGIDVNVMYRKSTDLGSLLVNATGSWERFDQQFLPGSVPQQITGTIFNPPTLKFRGMVGWENVHWGVSLFVNHISAELNTTATPNTVVAPWTTLDGQWRYERSGWGLSLSVQNILGSAPPSISASSTIPRGLGFDPDNYSAVGRFMALEVSKEVW